MLLAHGFTGSKGVRTACLLVSLSQLRPTVQALTEVNIPAFLLDVLITIQEVLAGLEICVFITRVSTIELSSDTHGIQYQAN